MMILRSILYLMYDNSSRRSADDGDPLILALECDHDILYVFPENTGLVLAVTLSNLGIEKLSLSLFDHLLNLVRNRLD
jgi:hypothetical protein